MLLDIACNKGVFNVNINDITPAIKQVVTNLFFFLNGTKIYISDKNNSMYPTEYIITSFKVNNSLNTVDLLYTNGSTSCTENLLLIICSNNGINV